MVFPNIKKGFEVKKSHWRQRNCYYLVNISSPCLDYHIDGGIVATDQWQTTAYEVLPVTTSKVDTMFFEYTNTDQIHKNMPK